jgi:tetratricopeptide (TPR) repeat protein
LERVRPFASGPLALVPLTLAAAVLGACQTPSPPHVAGVARPAASWRVEPLLRVDEAPGTAQGYYALGRNYQRQGRLALALGAYRRAVELDPRHAEAHNAIGVVSGLKGRLEEAIAAFETALELAPSAPHVLSNLGYALALAGRPAQAIPTLQRAARLEPDNERIRHNLVLAERLQTPDEDRRGSDEAAGAAAAEIASPPAGHQHATIRIGVDAHARADAIRIGPDTESTAAVKPPGQTFVVETSESARSQWVQIGAAVIELRPTSHSPEATLVASRDPSYVGRQEDAAQPPAVAYRLEVINGNGIERAAARIGAWLATAGAPRARLANKRPFDQRDTVVYYAEGFQPTAQQLAARFTELAIRVHRADLRSADVRIVLGRDVLPSLAAMDRERERLAVRTAPSPQRPGGDRPHGSG